MDPYELLFGGMNKLGPGSNEDTLKVLNMLPQKEFQLVVDAGCGSGRQTLVLAKALNIKIHALDLFDHFLEGLSKRAKEQKLSSLVETHNLNIADIQKKFRDVDLIWSEGSAYNIGFENALKTWAPALKPKGFLVVSELSWEKEQIPEKVKLFFRTEYPDMKSLQENIEIVKKAGYKLLNTHKLPKQTWVDGFYDVLKPKAKSLINHSEEPVRKLANEMLKEIDVFENAQDSFAYYFFILQR